MRSVNRVTFIGHLAANPELRQTKKGLHLATFSLATNRYSLDENGKKRSLADFHRIVAWGKMAEICNQYLVKGSAVYIEGRIVNSSFEDKDGNRHYRTEIVLDHLNILTSKKKKDGRQEIGIEDVPGTSVDIVEEAEVIEAEAVAA